MLNKMSYCFLCLAILVLMTIFSVKNASAFQNPDSTQLGAVESDWISLSLSGAAGMLQGQAKEVVYDNSTFFTEKASELTWDLKDIIMAGGLLSIQFNKLMNGRISASYWAPVSQGTGGMTDYDWYISGEDWTDMSISDVDVTSGYMFDVNASMDIIRIHAFSLRGMLGFKSDHWEWEDQTYDYIYSENGFRDTVGSFYGENGINYEQTFTVPYIGLEAGLISSILELKAYFNFSSQVTADDKDYHVFRDIHFKESFTGGQFYNAGIEAICNIDSHWFISAALDYQTIPEIIGDTTIEGEWLTYTDSAGIENTTTMYYISTGCKF